ncbi:hypothetical protein [Methyloraptor flagellatus]|jgi:hypothetical protein|uniref:Uncharacterized protein n=1 Tax=Methyloraptor flagellatus TaxID=3162530 RepID=A0AAU7XAQ5_9HYPH
MLSFLVRAIGLWFMAGAIVAVVVDGMKSIAAGRLVLTPAAKLWFDLSPGTLAAAQSWVQKHLGAFAWDPLAQAALALPSWALLVAIGAVFVWLGSLRRRRREDVAYEA